MTFESAHFWLRELCHRLPATYEKLSHGTPSFFHQKGKQFVVLVDNHHGDGRLALWVPTYPGIQQSLVDENSTLYFIPPYVGVKGWVGIRLDQPHDSDQAEGLVVAAYELTKKRSQS